MSDLSVANLRKLRVNVDNPHYSALNEILTELIKRRPHFSAELGAGFNLALDTSAEFLGDSTCPVYMHTPIKAEKTFILKGGDHSGGSGSA